MELSSILREMEEFARKTFTPIIKEESWAVLRQVLLDRQPKQILEIGTAIGYSAIRILNTLPSSQLISLEIRHCRHEQAKINLSKIGYLDRAILRLVDAKDFLKDTSEKFDFIFLDGAKGQYASYLPYIEKVLTADGVVFSDNLDYDGRVAIASDLGIDAIPRKHRAAVKGLMTFRRKINEHPFQSVFYSIGDGIAVTTKDET